MLYFTLSPLYSWFTSCRYKGHCRYSNKENALSETDFLPTWPKQSFYLPYWILQTLLLTWSPNKYNIFQTRELKKPHCLSSRRTNHLPPLRGNGVWLCVESDSVLSLWTCSLIGSSVHGVLSKSAGLGCRVLLQWIFPTPGLNSRLLSLLHWQAGSLQLAPPGKPVMSRI